MTIEPSLKNNSEAGIALFVKYSRLRCHDPGFTVGRFS